MLRKLLNDMHTGIDGESYDVIRVLGTVVIVGLIGLEAYDVIIQNKTFDMQSYGIAVAAIFAAIGGGLKLKEKTEPPMKKEAVDPT